MYAIAVRPIIGGVWVYIGKGFNLSNCFLSGETEKAMRFEYHEDATAYASLLEKWFRNWSFQVVPICSTPEQN